MVTDANDNYVSLLGNRPVSREELLTRYDAELSYLRHIQKMHDEAKDRYYILILLAMGTSLLTFIFTIRTLFGAGIPEGAAVVLIYIVSHVLSSNEKFRANKQSTITCTEKCLADYKQRLVGDVKCEQTTKTKDTPRMQSRSVPRLATRNVRYARVVKSGTMSKKGRTTVKIV